MYMDAVCEDVIGRSKFRPQEGGRIIGDKVAHLITHARGSIQRNITGESQKFPAHLLILQVYEYEQKGRRDTWKYPSAPTSPSSPYAWLMELMLSTQGDL
ncbi:MAG: hypothetical protein K0S36_2485 [Nitrosospira multiformis]|jgi:hypothetical protein|nr:hypothetical protein [Nitrosospira multiformis]